MTKDGLLNSLVKIVAADGSGRIQGSTAKASPKSSSLRWRRNEEEQPSAEAEDVVVDGCGRPEAGPFCNFVEGPAVGPGSGRTAGSAEDEGVPGHVQTVRDLESLAYLCELVANLILSFSASADQQATPIRLAQTRFSPR
ncbi:MAG: hypothetical protein KF760_29310 [Candidatus Eremiobacteraeota bacterium]|nr:hypothetical protein [Candidatus Eremiobacteraeota bacterium]MCW5865927.1 hypothetical protein [Candidatus Eremiobacteraeota bacterium]